MRLKTVNKKYSRFSVPVFLFCFLIGTTQMVTAELGPEERCLDCHDDTWAEGLAQMYIHSPFQEQQCQTCHVASPFKNDRKQNRKERGQVKWIERNFTPTKTHWFKFSALDDYGTLFVEAGGHRGKILQHKISLPVLGDLQRYDNDHSAPKISNVKVLEVKRGLFLSATIGWETDEIASSMVSYGIKKINMSSPRDNSLTTSHQVTLSGIKSKKTYRVKVVSEDLFGNKVTSDPFTFSTDKLIPMAEDPPFAINADFGKIGIDTNIFQSDDQYLVKITANQSVKMAIGFVPDTANKSTYVKDPNAPQDIKHVLTNNEFKLNTSICYGCHRRYQEGMSHPVNVYPKRGMVIPPEYSTLADGRMTCMSCHERHSSRRANRLIKSSSRELCSGCHKEMR